MTQVEEHTPNEKLPLAQPEEQGEYRGTAASEGSGEGVDEAYEKAREPDWHGAKSAHAGVILHTLHSKSLKKMAREYYSGTIWDPNYEGEGNMERRNGGELTVLNFDDTEPESTPMDRENLLSNGQYLPEPANFTKTSNIPYREGIRPATHTPKPNAIATDTITPEIRKELPQVSSDKSRGGGGTPCINAGEHKGCATHLDRVKSDLRGLEGEGDIRWVSGGEENYLPVFQDAGGVPQHRKVGYRPMVDGRPGGQHDVGNEGRRREIATVGIEIAARRYQLHVTT